MPPRAIETRYKGYRFRSRLEARWAVFFDSLGLKWEYEPEGFELEGGVRYLPDFKVQYPGRNPEEAHHEWFECKGDLRAVTPAEWSKMIEFQRAHGLIVLDGTPDTRMYLPANAVCAVAPDTDDSVMSSPLAAQAHAFEHRRDGYALWCGKGRMWYDHHDNFFDPTSDCGCGGLVLERAVQAARSARFEHGESGVRK